MNKNDKKYSVDTNRIGVDWKMQQKNIMNAIEEQQQQRHIFTWKRLAYVSVIPALILSFVLYSHFSNKDQAEEYVTYELIDSYEVNDIPESLNVLNGYTISNDDFYDYIIGEENEGSL